MKTEPHPGTTANFTVFNTGIKDFQTQVVNAQVGVLRGYLANAGKVRVRGAEFDGTAQRQPAVVVLRNRGVHRRHLRHRSPDAPPPLEETGGPQVKDISGSVLPGISKLAMSIGGEHANPAVLFGRAGELFGAVDGSYRSEFHVEPVSVEVSRGRRIRIAQRPRGLSGGPTGWTIQVWSAQSPGCAALRVPQRPARQLGASMSACPVIHGPSA